MDTPEKIKKMVSKFYRLKLRDQLEECFSRLPICGLEENQVGNFIYSGSGKILIGVSHEDASVRVRLVEDSPVIQVRVPSRGILASAPLGGSIRTELEEKILKSLS